MPGDGLVPGSQIHLRGTRLKCHPRSRSRAEAVGRQTEPNLERSAGSTASGPSPSFRKFATLSRPKPCRHDNIPNIAPATHEVTPARLHPTSTPWPRRKPGEENRSEIGGLCEPRITCEFTCLSTKVVRTCCGVVYAWLLCGKRSAGLGMCRHGYTCFCFAFMGGKPAHQSQHAAGRLVVSVWGEGAEAALGRSWRGCVTPSRRQTMFWNMGCGQDGTCAKAT